MRSIAGKVAWVTGAGSGIGRAGALALAEDGAELVLSGRREPPLEETAAAIREAGGQAMVEPLDVADKGAVGAAVDRIEARLGRLDILVASAGINVPDRNWDNVSDDSWARIIDIDLSGAIYGEGGRGGHGNLSWQPGGQTGGYAGAGTAPEGGGGGIASGGGGGAAGYLLLRYLNAATVSGTLSPDPSTICAASEAM